MKVSITIISMELTLVNYVFFMFLPLFCDLNCHIFNNSNTVMNYLLFFIQGNQEYFMAVLFFSHLVHKMISFAFIYIAFLSAKMSKMPKIKNYIQKHIS